MKEVTIESQSLFPNSRTKIMIGNQNWIHKAKAAIFIIQAGKPNTLILVTHPTEFDIKAAIQKETVEKDVRVMAGKLVETIKGCLE